MIACEIKKIGRMAIEQLGLMAEVDKIDRLNDIVSSDGSKCYIDFESRLLSRFERDVNSEEYKMIRDIFVHNTLGVTFTTIYNAVRSFQRQYIMKLAQTIVKDEYGLKYFDNLKL